MQLCEATTITELLREGQLSVRSSNVCYKHKLRTIGEICKYFNSHGDFFGLRNIGERSNYELSELCNRYYSLLQKETNDPQFELIAYIKPRHPVFQRFESLSIEHKSLAEQLYQNLILRLSVRAINALSLFCKGNNLEALLVRLNEVNFDLNALKNVGQKTAEELKCFFETLHESIEPERLDSENTRVRSEALLHQMKSVIGDMSVPCRIFIVENFTNLQAGRFPLMRFIELMMKEPGVVKTKYQYILIELSGFYKLGELHTTEEVAITVGVTKERVRQLLYKDQIQLRAIDKLHSAIELFIEFGLQIPSAFELQTNRPFYTKFTDFSEESPFTDMFFCQLLAAFNPSFLPVIFEIEDKKRPILLNKEFIRKVNIIELCQKLIDITADRVEEDFEVNVEGFISFYFIEEISWPEREELILAVEELIGELYGYFADQYRILTIKRTTKKKTWEYIYAILKEHGRAMHITEISAEMNKRGFEFEPSNVRGHTLKYDTKFIVAGGSTYGLKEWETEGKVIGGTIKQIIVKYLASFDEPKHLYDIARHVMQQRDTNVHSIHGIIQADTLNIFQSFGEHFIGLNDKEYNLSQFKINPVSNHWFKEVKRLFLKGNIALPKKKIIQYISELYGLRHAQVEYVIYNQVRKGGLIEKNELLILNESN